MLIDAYVGLASDSDFKMVGGAWNGNIPRRISPFFLKGNKMFDDFCKAGHDFLGMRFVQLDWGAWGADAQIYDIKRVIAKYGTNAAINEFVEHMVGNTEYVFIICEQA